MGTAAAVSKIRDAVNKDCAAQGHKMGHFQKEFGGHRSFCKRCGMTMHFNADSGKIWGDAASTACVPKEVMNTRIPR